MRSRSDGQQLLHEVAFRRELEDVWLPLLRRRGSAELPVYLEGVAGATAAGTGGVLVAYRDVREMPGRVVGLRLPSERLGELLLGAVRGANEATESPVTSANPADEGPRVVDQAGRTMFGEATSAIEGEADEPVSISLGESFPWHLELSLSASLNRYRR